MTLSIDAKADHMGFGFVNDAFDSFDHDEWGFGGNCILWYSDRDFRSAASFTPSNQRRWTLNQGDNIRIQVDCAQNIGKLWKDNDSINVLETTLPTRFALAVSLGGRVGSQVSVTQCSNHN